MRTNEIRIFLFTVLIADARFFEYELPNRTVTICPSYSLVSLECPQVSSPSILHSWQVNLPKYFIAIDYIRSYPLRLGYDVNSCQPDLVHVCHNYDPGYLNTLCNGRGQCSDLSANQVRERSLCAFKAVTEIGYHCVPTWNFYEISTKFDICGNSSLTTDYGFIYSRNYPLKTIDTACFTTIYARPNYQLVLYFVEGNLNHDQLKIESVTIDGLPILNMTLNGNLTTQRLAFSTYKIKITFFPSYIYSYNPTYYLLYFHVTPMCSSSNPCPTEPPILTALPITAPTTMTILDRLRIKSIGWTRVPNIWIVVPVVLAYILLLLFIVLLVLLINRRRHKQKKLLAYNEQIARHFNTNGSRAQLVTPLPSSSFVNGGNNTISSYYRPNTLPPRMNPSFTENPDRYYRNSQSDFDLNRQPTSYRPHSTVPMESYRGYGTVDYPNGHRPRRSLPKSFSDCDLCKRRVDDEEYQHDENWHFEKTLPRPGETRNYRDRIKQRSAMQQTPDEPMTTVEYSTVLPRQQRMNNNESTARHLPYEYISTRNPNTSFQRNSNEDTRDTQQTLNRYPYYHSQPQRYVPGDDSEI